jgi:hypothetical protein
MSKWNKGFLAGLVATIVLSVLMVIKSAMGLMPAVDAIGMLAKIAGDFGLPSNSVIGWVAHFVIRRCVMGPREDRTFKGAGARR